jgi:hypothetical protein
MSSPHLILAIWVIQAVTQAAIAIVLYRRKLHKEFPAFFLYVIVQLLAFCVQLPVYNYCENRIVYFEVYWVGTALDLVLSFKIIHEIFLDVFKPYHALKDLGTALFKWAALIMILLSAVLISFSSTQDPMITSILTVQRCVRVVQCGLVVFLLAFSSSLAVNWRRLSFGIALGFGVVAGGELLASALLSGQRLHTPFWQVSTMLSYELGSSLWLFYSLCNRRRDMAPVLVPQRWDEALMDIQSRESEGDSLIPMFEHMVDQALSKTNSTHS